MSVVTVGRVQKDGRELTKRLGDCERNTINISLYPAVLSCTYGRGQEPASRIVRVSDYSRPSLPPRAQTAPTAASNVSNVDRSQRPNSISVVRKQYRTKGSSIEKDKHQCQSTKDQLHKMQPQDRKSTRLN